MRLASYNVENMFLRAVALNRTTHEAGRQALETQVQLNAVFARAAYSPQDKQQILTWLDDLDLLRSDDGGRFALLRQNHGKLLVRHNNGTVDVVANGRADWIGWVELKVEEVNETATQMTARVINDVNPDVLALVEAESRPAIARFARGLVAPGGAVYAHAMLIDGNDDRGIDVGILTKAGYEIASMQSHVDDVDGEGEIFSRDCPVYRIKTPAGHTIAVVPNHLKSKGFGSGPANDHKRRRQAVRIRAIYQALIASGTEFVAIVGDFNDTLDSQPLAPLTDSNLRDVSALPDYDPGPDPERTGTYGNCRPSDKIDHILLSPALFARASTAGVNRMGVWGGTHGTLFPHYDAIHSAAEAASDHAAIWVELDV